MPALKQVLESVTDLTFPYGETRFKLKAYLERMDGAPYRALVEEELQLRDEQNRLLRQIDTEIAGYGEPKDPGEPAFLTFRNLVNTHLVAITANAMELETNPESGRQLISTSLDAVWNALEEFDKSILPAADDLQERRDAIETTLKEIRESIAGVGEKIKANHAARLKNLLHWWDVTETEAADSPLVLIEVDNLLPFSAGLLADMLRAVEGKVRAR